MHPATIPAVPRIKDDAPVKMVNNLILVVGSTTTNTGNSETTQPEQLSLVGIATSLSAAQSLVGKDYVSVCANFKLNPMFNAPHAINSEDGVIGYAMNGYTWHFISLPVNELVNFTL